MPDADRYCLKVWAPKVTYPRRAMRAGSRVVRSRALGLGLLAACASGHDGEFEGHDHHGAGYYDGEHEHTAGDSSHLSDPLLPYYGKGHMHPHLVMDKNNFRSSGCSNSGCENY